MNYRFTFFRSIFTIISILALALNSYGQISKLINFNNPYPGTFPTSMQIDNDYLFGTTAFGGKNNKGVLYKIDLKSKVYTALIEFDSITNGWWPNSIP